MNAAINFSRFAYRSAKPRLTLYERHDKENLPAAASRRSPTPNNATPIPSTRSARDTPRGGNERRLPTVIPETPDEESVSSCGRGRRRMRPAAERDRRRKRQRLSSSSSSSGGETETESRDAGRGSGARDGRRTGGLFGSLQVSKRQKRSVELSVFEYQPNSDKKSPPKNDRKEAAGGESSELTDSPPPVSKLKCCGRRNLESDSSESESEECCEVSQRNRGSATTTLVTLPPAQCEDGWLTCRRKPLHSLTTTTSSNGTGRRRRRGGVKAGEMKDGRPGERWERELVGQNKEDSTLREGRPGEAKELDSLRQLFPQYSEMFLRDRLRESAAMDEAVASILASDDPPSSPKKPAQPKSRRIRLLSDSHSTSTEDEDDDLPNVDLSTAGRGERGGGGRKGRRRLDDSLDDDKCLPQPRMARPAHNIPSLSSESSLSGSETRGKEEEVEEEEGEEEKGEEGDERSNIERNKSESDRLCSVSESGVRSKLSGCGKSLLADGATTRISGKTKGWTPDLEELEGDLSEPSEEEEDNFSELQKTAILSLLEGISTEEAQAVPGLSESRAALLLARRPFQSWYHLTEAVASVKGLSQKCLEGCVRLLKEREMLAGLLSECQAISSSIESLVDKVRLRKEEKEEQQLQENSASDIVDFPLPSMIAPGLVLKPYQKVGVSWLSLLHSQNLNAILADEMGLGKTIQTIVFLSHLYEKGWKGPHLIVVPASTIDNWVRELNCWSPSLNVLTYWGSMGERSDMRHDLLFGDHKNYYDVILTTYTICIGRAEDRKFLRKLQLKTLVLDEGHMLKNMATLKYNHLMKIQAERRLLLTGTPLQNNLLELMSLLSFVMPSVFRPYLQPLQSAFRHSRHTAEVGDYYMEQVSRAKEIMRPFILRRLKKEVLNQLPDKVEIVEHCALTSEQLELYHREVELGRKEIKNGGGKELVKSMSVLTQLRKAANHPLLLRNHYSNDIISSMSTEILKEAEYRDADVGLVAEDMSVMSDFELHNLCLRHEALAQYRLSDDLIKESGKLKYLEKKLTDCKQQGKRVLIFSQFTMVLDILEAWLKLLNHAHLRLDGTTHMNYRQVLIDQYNSSEDILVFLLSTKAGGLGINLTSASVVVIHDIDFNPYNDKQAEDRCHRVGQTREVEVVRLVGRDTVEEEILKCAQQKLKLEQDMTAGSQLNKTDMASLLSQGLKL